VANKTKAFDDMRQRRGFGLAIGGVTVTDAECVNKSFPGFWNELAGVLE
jgi:5-enolpyruvylshikimate-3-phosphate synthase